MSAQLPYLPPLDTFRGDVASIAARTAEQVRAAQSTAGKVGTTIGGALSAVPAAARLVNNVVAAPGQAVANTATDFTSGVFQGLNFPQPTAAPVSAVAPAAPVAPATQQPVAAAPEQAPAGSAVPNTSLYSGRVGNNVAVTGFAPSAPALSRVPTIVQSSPVSTGIQQQAAYAAQQRQAIMDEAERLAAAHPGQGGLYLSAALHGLPQLSGTNSFASTQAQLAAEQSRTAEAERANIRTTEATRYGQELQAEGIRRQIQPIMFHVPNPDPNTRMFAPFMPVPGFVRVDDKGQAHVYDHTGAEVKPQTGSSAAPIVGTRTSQKDGNYNAGGKTVTIKGGVVTEVK